MSQIFKVTGSQKDNFYNDFTYFFRNKGDAINFLRDLVSRGYPNCKLWKGNSVTHGWDIIL